MNAVTAPARDAEALPGAEAEDRDEASTDIEAGIDDCTAADADTGTTTDPDTDDRLRLSEPDVGELEQQLVAAALAQPLGAGGPLGQAFEQRFAQWLGRGHAVAVASGTLGTWIALKALGIGPGDEVIASAHGWHQVAQAVTLAGATLKFADIDYWSGCLDPARAALQITPATRALLAGNVNGHPADWRALRALADAHGLALIEDSTEAIGSRTLGRPVGSFGDIAVFDFSPPAALCCGEGGMLVTDDARLAAEARLLRSRTTADRRSVSAGARVPLQAGLGELAAALGLAQLARIDEILARRQAVEQHYRAEMLSFEGIKPPYQASEVEAVHWMLYLVHLGKRFTASACDQIVEDMAEELVECVRYCQPLHQQFHYRQLGWQRGQLPLTERIADRALALPLHGGLQASEVRFIVQTLKDSSVNVGAGAAIY